MSRDNFSDDIKANIPLALAQTMSRTDTLEQRYLETREEHKESMKKLDDTLNKIFTKLDEWNIHISTCPHLKMDEIEKGFRNIWGWIKSIVFAIVTISGAVVISVLTMHMK